MRQKSILQKHSTRKRTRMKVEKRHLKHNLFVSSTFNHSHTFRPVRTRHAPLALGAPRGLKLERRARMHRARPRTQATEGTERKGLDTRERQKILGEFYHKKTVNKKRVEEEGMTKKTEHRKNIAFETTSPNERKATRTPCQQPTSTRKRREHVNAREHNRTHANTIAVCNIVIQQIHMS